MNAVNTAIFTLFGADDEGDFYTAIGGRLRHKKAVQGDTFPYCVYQMVSMTSEFSFDEERRYLQYQFSIFTENNSAASAGTALGYLIALFNNCTLSVSGWRFLSMVLTDVVANDDLSVVPPVMGYTAMFEIEIEKGR